ncbi:MAG TPA: arsenate reductase ArsC [Desulfuromonadales bacterium]|nr:arsenate reductase ArsC [Desulfuromonadales bacterium]
MDKERVLFICNHNSARSQMAEAWLKLLAGERFVAESAGFDPRPINPLVIEVMRETGVDLSGKKSQSVFDVYRRGQAFQYVISVCSRNAEMNCPIFPGAHKNRFRVVFPDPSELAGSSEERLAGVRRIRDEIKAAVEQFLHWINAGSINLPGPQWERD